MLTRKVLSCKHIVLFRRLVHCLVIQCIGLDLEVHCQCIVLNLQRECRMSRGRKGPPQENIDSILLSMSRRMDIDPVTLSHYFDRLDEECTR